MFYLEQHWKNKTALLQEAVTKLGSPLYCYDKEIITSKYHELKNAFSWPNIRIHYACKANNNLHILKHIHQLGGCIDAVSIFEVQIALRAGFDPEQVLFTPNGVSFEELKQGIELGVKVNVDNLSLLEQCGAAYASKIPICIRLNPHIAAGGNYHIQTGHIDSKFGISIHQLRHVIRIVNHYKLNVEGLHIHTGSEILDAEVFLRVAELLFECARDFPDLSYIDFGSGFKIPYHEHDTTTNIAELGLQLSNCFEKFCSSYGRKLTLCFEPGKFLLSESGILLVNAEVVKQTLSTVFVGVNSGQNHLIRPMFYDAYHHIVNLTNLSGRTRIYTVTGNICETDTFGWDRKLNEVHEGDLLGILNAGAYGFSMSNNYNSRPRPAEVLLDGNDSFRLIRRRESLDDLLNTIA